MITAYIFISAAQRDMLAPVGLPADRSFVKHNFVPTPPLHAEITTERQVAYVGRLDEAKGAPFLMRAWDAFRARHSRSSLRLVVVGGGDMSGDRSQLGDTALFRDDRWSRLAAGGVAHPGRIPCSHRPIAMGRDLRHGCSRGDGRWHASRRLRARGFPRVGEPRVGRGALRAYGCRRRSSKSSQTSTTTRSGGRAYGQQARQTYASRFSPDASIERLLEIYRFAVEHPLERSSRSEDLAGPSARSPFGVPT